MLQVAEDSVATLPQQQVADDASALLPDPCILIRLVLVNYTGNEMFH